jgi:hypothetical protein
MRDTWSDTKETKGPECVWGGWGCVCPLSVCTRTCIGCACQMYTTTKNLCLLWIDKVRGKDKTYLWVHHAFWYKKTVMSKKKVFATRNLEDCLPNLQFEPGKGKKKITVSKIQRWVHRDRCGVICWSPPKPHPGFLGTPPRGLVVYNESES